MAAVIALTALVATPAAAGTESPTQEAPDDWRVVQAEDFDTTLAVDRAPWVKDPQTATSRWAVDQMDDNGALWRKISDPAFSR